MDLFEKALEQSIQSEAPLADRMRPRTLEEFVGQQHILAPGRLLRRAIQADQLSKLRVAGSSPVSRAELINLKIHSCFVNPIHEGSCIFIIPKKF